MKRTIEHYEVLDMIGRGGMGMVYRARNTVDGTMVALKTLLKTSEGQRDSIRREIRTLAQIRHPGIVRILDHGIFEGSPWYAMELLSGVNLGHYLRRRVAGAMPPAVADDRTDDRSETRHVWWTNTISTADAKPTLEVPSSGAHGVGQVGTGRSSVGMGTQSPIEQILTIVRWICAPLSYLHGEGIVHRDLKPANILITDDGMPVLVDFGLTAHFSGKDNRDRLHIEGGVMGTIGYIAPEQIRGELVDARADLYALGCIMYEMLVGHPPFVGVNRTDILRAHLYADPIPPSKLVRGIPDQLDRLVLGLLEKKPRQRVGFADTVSNILARIVGEVDSDIPLPASVLYLYRSGFTGRENELGHVVSLGESAKSGHGGLFFISGEGGIGKTRFAIETGNKLKKAGNIVLAGSFTNQVGRVLEGFQKPLQMIVDHCHQIGAAETSRVFGRRASVLSLYEPTIDNLPCLEKDRKVPELPAEQAKLRLFSALVDTFIEMSQQGPLVIIIDDLHWADELSLDFLSFLAKTDRFGHESILVIGTCRHELVPAALTRIMDNQPGRTLCLKRLDPQSQVDIVREMLAIDSPPPSLIAYLERYGRGNPFFIAEYVRLAVERKLLRRNDRGHWYIDDEDVLNASRRTGQEPWESWPLPHSLKELIETRLIDLDRVQQEIVDVAAVLGGEMDIPTIHVMAEIAEGPFQQAFDMLMDRGILEKTTLEKCRFCLPSIQEIALGKVETMKRTSLHRTAAMIMERITGDDFAVHLPALAYHWEHAGDAALARDYYRRAAQQAYKRLAINDAERFYLDYLRLSFHASPERIYIRTILGRDIYLHRGLFDEARDQFEQAIKEAESLGDMTGKARTMVSQGKMSFMMNQYSTARKTFLDALELLELGQNRDLALEAEILCKIGDTEYKLDQKDSAEHFYLQSLTILEEIQDLDVLARLYANRSILHLDDVERAREYSQKAIDYARQLGDGVIEYTCLGNLAVTYYNQKDFQKAKELFTASMEAARKSDNVNQIATAMGNLANTLCAMGQAGEAIDYYNQAIDIFKITGDQAKQANYSWNLASHYLSVGQLDMAHTNFARAVGCVPSTERDLYRLRYFVDYAWMELLLHGPTDVLDQLLQRMEIIAGDSGNAEFLVDVIAIKGHRAIARGHDPSPFIAEMKEIIASHDLEQPNFSLQKLLQAREAQLAGQLAELVNGYHLDHYDDVVKRALLRRDRRDS